MCHPTQAIMNAGRAVLVEHLPPTSALSYTQFTAGMSRRMGTASVSSWALSHVHIAFLDSELNRAFESAVSPTARHDLACAAVINLLAYLAWLRSQEVFGLTPRDITVIPPCVGPRYGMAPRTGAVCADLLEETKSSRTKVADIVVAYRTLSGLQLGRWMTRLLQFAPRSGSRLFSTSTYPKWTSYIFREYFAYPILELLRRRGEPTLQIFSDVPGNRIRDAVTGMHSWKRGGRSKVSRAPRHTEPHHHLFRIATDPEIYEHGRWERKKKTMAELYNQWELGDRVCITLICM
jgi:hypothetical protein